MSPRAANLRLTSDGSLVSWCRDLGAVDGSGNYEAESLTRMLNYAASLGATTVVRGYVAPSMTSILFGGQGSKVTGNAYDCTFAMTRLPDSLTYAPYFARGTATLAGQGFLTTRGGEVRLAAGRAVTVDPATDYALEWYSKIGVDPDRFDEMPQASVFARARHQSTVDAQGRFKFDGLPAGLYIVRTIVTWDAGSPVERQGGVVSDTIRLRAGETRDLILSKTRP